MVELGELEKQHDEFARRATRIVAVSSDGLEDTAKVQADFPHLTILSDVELDLIAALEATHHAASTAGKTIAAPTTLLIHRGGRIVWTFRPQRHVERLSVAELLKAVDQFSR